MQKNQNLIQLSWHDIHITANITVGKCLCCKPGVTTQKKIIDGVSGTVMPGQFLAIIGASGNSHISVSLTKTCFRCW
jgi:ABC-type protease/lipase transport system fused ATPase/permease subunit